jgi:membrane associated rhomboid family serine protease
MQNNYNQIYFPKLSPINKIILITVLAIFILDSLMMKVGGGSLAPFFVLSPDTFFKGHVYTLFTYPLLCQSIWELFFNGLLLWFVGAELETMWGRKKYLFFLLFSQLIAGILFLGVASSVTGMGPAMLTSLHGLSQAMILAYGIIFPDRHFSFMFIFPVKAKYFCLIIVALETYMAFIGQGGLGAVGHLLQMAMAFVAMLLMTKPLVKRWLEGEGTGFKLGSKKKKGHLSLVDTDDDDNKPPKYWQ